VSALAADRRRILVVDDEMGPRESLRMLLKPYHDVHTAESALAVLGDLGRLRPDLVILDIKMPDIDGLEALRRIKAEDPSIEVVMITAYASLETVRLALSHGAFEYLVKPFSRQDLETVVRRALLRREASLGTESRIAALVEEMRHLTVRTYALEEAARREGTEQSLRVTQLSIVRELARTIVRQLDLDEVTRVVREQLVSAFGYDRVLITLDPAAPVGEVGPPSLVCRIEDAEGPLGALVVDNRASGRAIEAPERELLEMLSEYLAVAVRNSRLYGEIAATKRSLEQLVASAGDAIISIGDGDRIEGWNPAAERIFRRPAREVQGQPVAGLLGGGAYRAARERVEQGGAAHAFEFTTLLPGGQEARMAATLAPLRERRAGLGRLIAIARDITSQRALENQLHQSDKLRALGQLAGGIAHDFNNLLQAIVGYAQLLRDNPDNSELFERSLGVIEAVAHDGSETVRSIQQFARLRPDEELVAVDLDRVIQDALAITRPRWDEHSRASRTLALSLRAAPVARVRGRPAALVEMLTNLILNGIEAMPDGGTLEIATAPGPDGSVVLRVTDTGVGMPEAVRLRVFEPFFSTKGEAGSGLGLAMAYSIAMRHGATIDCASEPGGGAAFTITFPAAAPEGPGELEDPPPAPALRRPARVLLADDHAPGRNALADVLTSLGYSVVAVASGAQALAAYAPGRFDAIVADVGMPGMTGWELAEHVRARDRAIPLFLITGGGLLEGEQDRLTALEIQGALYKPVKPANLDAALQTALAGGVSGGRSDRAPRSSAGGSGS
jgi:PAS domain S-box-containing protein